MCQQFGPQDTVAVFGPGPIGLIMSLILKAVNATVILIGITQDEKRLTMATALGVDSVFECSGSATALHNAFKIVKKKGRVIQEGLFAKDMIAIDMSLLIHKEIEYIGSRTQKPSSWVKALALLADEKINLDSLISAIYPLEEWEQAFNAVMAGDEIKVLLQP